MPTLSTLLEIALDPISQIVLALYATLMIWKGLAPARTQPVYDTLFKLLRNPRDLEF